MLGLLNLENTQPGTNDVIMNPDVVREKFMGDEKEVDVLCPMCGTKHQGELSEE